MLTFNRLESIEANYMDKNTGVFSSKTFSTEERNT